MLTLIEKNKNILYYGLLESNFIFSIPIIFSGSEKPIMGKLEKVELYIDKYFEKNNAETFAFCTDGFYYDGSSCIVFFFPQYY